jgi:hypothetical protein
LSRATAIGLDRPPLCAEVQRVTFSYIMKKRAVSTVAPPTREDFVALPSKIRLASGAIEVHVDRNLMFAGFIHHFDRALGTSPHHPNYDKNVADEMERRGIDRNKAVTAAEARHKAALHVFAFTALRYLLTDEEMLNELFTIAFEASMARARSELTDAEIVTDSSATVYIDHSESKLRDAFLQASYKRVRGLWEKAVGGDRRSKVAPAERPDLVSYVAVLRPVWSAIKRETSRDMSIAAVRATARRIATNRGFGRDHEFILDALAALLVGRGVEPPARTPQALAAAHAALALGLQDRSALNERPATAKLPTRWNRLYQSARKRSSSAGDDNHPTA